MVNKSVYLLIYRSCCPQHTEYRICKQSASWALPRTFIFFRYDRVRTSLGVTVASNRLFSMPQKIHDRIRGRDRTIMTGENRRTRRETSISHSDGHMSHMGWPGKKKTSIHCEQPTTRTSCYWISSTERVRNAMQEKGEWLALIILTTVHLRSKS